MTSGLAIGAASERRSGNFIINKANGHYSLEDAELLLVRGMSAIDQCTMSVQNIGRRHLTTAPYRLIFRLHAKRIAKKGERERSVFTSRNPHRHGP